MEELGLASSTSVPHAAGDDPRGTADRRTYEHVIPIRWRFRRLRARAQHALPFQSAASASAVASWARDPPEDQAVCERSRGRTSRAFPPLEALGAEESPALAGLMVKRDGLDGPRRYSTRRQRICGGGGHHRDRKRQCGMICWAYPRGAARRSQPALISRLFRGRPAEVATRGDRRVDQRSTLGISCVTWRRSRAVITMAVSGVEAPRWRAAGILHHADLSREVAGPSGQKLAATAERQ